MFYQGGNDPLLFNNSMNRSQQINPNNLSDLYAQLYTQQKVVENQQQCVRDWIGELDTTMKEIDNTTAEKLKDNEQYVQLNTKLQLCIQSELMSLIRYKLNTNPNVTDNIKSQLDIIKDTTNEVKSIERQNIAELNDYMKNYSSMSFDDYKKMKDGGNNNKKKTKNNEQNAH